MGTRSWFVAACPGIFPWLVNVGLFLDDLAIPEPDQSSQPITSSLESQYHKHQSYVYSAFWDLKLSFETNKIRMLATWQPRSGDPNEVDSPRLIMNFKCKTSSQRHSQLSLDGKRDRWVLLPFLFFDFLLILATSRGDLFTVVYTTHLVSCFALGGDQRRNIVSRFPPPGLFAYSTARS